MLKSGLFAGSAKLSLLSKSVTWNSVSSLELLRFAAEDGEAEERAGEGNGADRKGSSEFHRDTP